MVHTDDELVDSWQGIVGDPQSTSGLILCTIPNIRRRNRLIYKHSFKRQLSNRNFTLRFKEIRLKMHSFTSSGCHMSNSWELEYISDNDQEFIESPRWMN